MRPASNQCKPMTSHEYHDVSIHRQFDSISEKSNSHHKIPLTTCRGYIKRLVLLPNMMTSSNGNIFRVTDSLYGELTGHRWIPLTKASDSELWCFLSSVPEKTSKQSCGWWFETPSRSLWRHRNETFRCHDIIVSILHPIYQTPDLWLIEILLKHDLKIHIKSSNENCGTHIKFSLRKRHSIFQPQGKHSSHIYP